MLAELFLARSSNTGKYFVIHVYFLTLGFKYFYNPDSLMWGFAKRLLQVDISRDIS